MFKFHKLKVDKIKQITDESVEIFFEVPQNLKSNFLFTAGQYITISKIINQEEVRRSYSLCSCANSNILSIGVKRIENGLMSSYLTKDLKVGDYLNVMQPNGTFCLNDEKKVVAICAGSGITPILSMLKSNDRNFTLIYGNKSQSSTMFLEEINKMNITTYFTYTRENIDGCYNSRIDNNLLKNILSKQNYLNADGYFICGPGDMIELVEEFLLNNGVDKSKIHFEKFTSNTKNKAQEIVSETDDQIISNVTVIMDGDEFDYQLAANGETILDSAMSVGADVPYSCKGGVCCTCKAKVIEGKAVMTENFSLSEEEVEEGFILTCMAHPVSEKIVVDFDEM